MKRLFKNLGFSLLALLLILLLAAMVMPKDLLIKRNVIVKAPKATVFNQIKYFKNWVNWSPWVAKEPAMNILYLGDDGEVNSSYQWKGDEMGKGVMTNTGITDQKLGFQLHFIEPWDGNAEGSLEVKDLNNGTSEVTWNMVNHGSFPMNALNFLTEYIIGKDFEHGLQLLKTYCESNPQIAISENDILEKEFPATTFASIRKKISFTEMQEFSTTAFATLASSFANRINSAPSTIYYDWDEKNMTADIAPAYAVTGTQLVAGVDMVDVPKASSCQMNYIGGYAGMGSAHEIMGQYIAKRSKNLSYVIEQYLVGPADTGDSTKWATNIIYVLK